MANGIGGKKKLKFRTTKRENDLHRKKLITIFVLVILVVAAVSITVLVKEYNLFGKDKTDETGNFVSDTELQDKVSILFAGSSNQKDNVTFLSVITLDTDKKTFKVMTVSPEEKIENHSLNSIYAAKGEEGLMKATSHLTSIPIDRYAIVTEKKFKNFILAIGYPEFDIKQNIDYKSNDFTLNLLEGKQSLSGDNLYKYIRYTGHGNTEYGLEGQAKIIGELLAQRLNEINTKKGDDLFSTAINNCESNITIIDFTKYYPLLSEISKEPRQVTYGTFKK